MKLKNIITVVLIIVSFTACDKETLDKIKENLLELTFFFDSTEITDLDNVINLNGTGLLTYTLDDNDFEALHITAKFLNVTNEKVIVNHDNKNNKGNIIIDSVIKEESTLEVTLTNNGKIIHTYQLKITNFKDEEEEEEEKKPCVSLKTLVGDDGLCNIHVRYHSNDITSSFELPISVDDLEGKQALDVNIATDNDTLIEFNEVKFANREDLYYKQLPEECYSFPSICHIPAEANTQAFNIELKNLNKLDMSDKWVLPLMIKEDPTYTLNTSEKQHKALLKIIPFNDYSGIYSSTGMNIYLGETTSDPATITTRTAYVVDDQSIFFYAGTWWEEAEDRRKYKVIIEFGEGVTDKDGLITGPIVLKAGDPENKAQIIANGECTYKRSVVKHATESHLNLETTVLYLNYYYTDFTSNPTYPIRFRATGSMSMQRKINTLIPDEDQANLW